MEVPQRKNAKGSGGAQRRETGKQKRAKGVRSSGRPIEVRNIAGRCESLVPSGVLIYDRP